MDIGQVLTETLRDGGGTYDARTLEPIVNGPWAVGGSLPGRQLPDTSLPSTLRAAWDALVDAGAVTIGTWLDERTLYVDAVDLIEDTDEAIALAASRGELAIYHLTTKTTLEVSR